MKITVKKPTEQEIAEMKQLPVWTCEVSEFDWFYGSQETFLLLEGDVTVTHAENPAGTSFKAGDLVVMPKGLKCRWLVKKPVKKHYVFES